MSCQFCNLPDDPDTTKWEVGLVDGQLIGRPGSSYELIRAVCAGDDERISKELLRVGNEADRATLIEILQRIGPMIGRRR